MQYFSLLVPRQYRWGASAQLEQDGRSRWHLWPERWCYCWALYPGTCIKFDMTINSFQPQFDSLLEMHWDWVTFLLDRNSTLQMRTWGLSSVMASSNSVGDNWTIYMGMILKWFNCPKKPSLVWPATPRALQCHTYGSHHLAASQWRWEGGWG